MDLWWKIGGSIRLELTGADVERTLGDLSARIRLEDIQWGSALTVEFTVPRWERVRVEAAAKRNGDKVRVVSRDGLPELLRSWLDAPVILAAVVILIAASLWLPSRVLFIRVEGNGTIPERQILEQAEGCGLYFGASRASLRSEQIKNRLLEAMPELSWVGVNTSGCVATISVRERQMEPEPQTLLPGSIVAVADAVVTELTATAGTPVVKVGEAVTAGQVLISGYTDLGLCTHVEAAQGEIYGLTRRETDVVIPAKTLVPGSEAETVKKYGLIIGKKRINFDSDSGILYAGCGKMTQIKVLRLPGGWELPVALVVETYSVTKQTEATRWEQSALETLENMSRAQTLQAMTAGQILREETAFISEDGVHRLTGLYECREMIGRRGSGILTEGDEYDGENSERGAG